MTRHGETGAVRVLASIGLVAALVLVAHWCGVTLCLVKRVFGVPCPMCGATRAVLLVLGGNVADAFAMQPLVMTLLVLSGPVALAAAFLPRFRRALAALARRPWAWALLAAAAAANWAWVIAHGN